MGLRFGSLRHCAIIGARLAVLCCCAVPFAQADEGAQVCADPNSTMLWEVRGEALNERGITVHLFGTMHVGKPEFYPLPAPVEENLRGAEHVVFEVDPRSASEPKAVAELQKRSQLRPGQHLYQLLSADTLVVLQAVLQEQNLAVDSMRRLKPWMISLLLGDLQSKALGFQAAWGLESYFMKERAPDSDVLQLESLRQQVDMLEKLDPEVFLGYSLHEFRESASEIEALAQAWRCGDHATLEALLFSDLSAPNLSEMQREGLMGLHEKLFTERNEVMADGIEKLIATGSDDYFVAVGAGHLLGADSVVALLRQRGYTVQPVRL
jgi:uncharacterized protein YbaP (TraB family)